MPRSTIVIAFILLALAIVSAGFAPPAQAAPAGATSLTFYMRAYKDREGPICRGDLVDISVKVLRAAESIDDEQVPLDQPITGVEVRGLVQNADVGDITPNNNITTWDSAGTPGSADFVFSAKKVGQTIISFRATVVTSGWLGTNWGGGSQTVAGTVSVLVVPCKFEVTGIGQWQVPGPANISITATSDDAEVKAQDGGSNNGGQGLSLAANTGGSPALQSGPLTGSTTVNWVVTTDKVEDCFAQLVTTSTQLDWNGMMDESSQLNLEGTYQAAAMSLPTYCVGSDGGIVDDSTPIQLALDPLQISSPSSGSVTSQYQELHGPEDMPGQVTVVVVPQDDGSAALNPSSRAVLPPWIILASVGLVLTPVFKRRNTGLKQIVSKRLTMFLIIFIPLLVLSACGTGAAEGPADSQATDSAFADSQESEEAIVDADVVFGSGDFILTNPNTGLADLSSYKATLTLTFDGTDSGQAEQWTRTYVLLSMQEPAVRHLTVQSAGDLPDLDPVFLAEADGAAYEKRGEFACNASVMDPENSQIDRRAPAGLLTGVVGAEEAGSETVNDLAANHYTFDERAFGLQSLAQSTGEIWVASEGGYIVKYLVTTEGDAAYFGEGIQGTLTWDYELTDVNALAAIELPADCPAGMVDAPLIADASNVLNMPSILVFDTGSRPADTAAFYQEEIPSLGWTLDGEANITDATALINFAKGDQKLTIIIGAGDGSTQVHILLSRSLGQEGIVAPPVETSTGETPLLPDATNVVTISGLVKYETSSTPEEAGTFYKEELQRLGWTLDNEIKTGGVLSFLFTKGTQSISILISAMGSGTTIAITTG